MTLLRNGQTLVSADRSRRYRVIGPIGRGAFGDTYKGLALTDRDDPYAYVCIKVAIERDAATTWHGESYFGHLSRGQERVVQFVDSFTHLSGSGLATRMLFVLIFELEEMTVADWFARGGIPWTKRAARRELRGLLEVLDKLHGMGAVHRDIHPANVFVGEGGRLKLGDFGIARHGISGGPVEADIFHRDFAPQSLAQQARHRWYASDDLYQLALLIVSLLTGDVTMQVTSRQVRELQLSSEFEAALLRATGPRSRRFTDARAMLTALQPSRPTVPVPESLAGLCVALTGDLRPDTGMTRSEAKLRIIQAGGIPQDEVNGKTQVVVVGRLSKNYTTPRRGRKLLDYEQRVKDGQRIAIIGWDDLLRLTPAPSRPARS